jgi:hypothetical protein
MNKSVSSGLVMTTLPVSEIQSLMGTLVSYQASAARPSVDICNRIANLQGLLDSGAPTSRNTPNRGEYSDWRGAANSSYQSPSSKWKHEKYGRAGGGAYNVAPPPQNRPQYSNAPPTTTAVAGTTDAPQQVIGRYQSRFKNTNKPVEDKILNNIILSKLNKFSEATYTDVREFLYQILGGGEADLQEFVRDFMRLVFRKAAAEEIFCPLYAKLLCEISSKYSVILDEMKSLSDKYLEVFEEVCEKETANYDEFVQKNIEKKYRLGYSQFLAELAKQEILPLEILIATVSTLIKVLQSFALEEDKKVIVEEYTDCLMRITRVFKGKTSAFSKEARHEIFKPFSVFYTNMQADREKFVSCSSKTRFILMDIQDILSH